MYESDENQLKPVFKDGVLLKRWTFDEIRKRVAEFS